MPYTHNIKIGVAALLAAASLAFPLSATADPVQPMSHDAAYELTCGHLGVPCAEKKSSKCGRSARSARRKVSVRAKRARCARHR